MTTGIESNEEFDRCVPICVDGCCRLFCCHFSPVSTIKKKYYYFLSSINVNWAI